MSNLRVWNFTSPPKLIDHYPVESVDEAVTLINTLSEIQLKNDRIKDNAFGLEVFEDGEWCEWNNEDGDDIMALAELDHFDKMFDKEV